MILKKWKREDTINYEETILNIGKVEKQITGSGTVLKGGADQILLPQGLVTTEWVKFVRVLPL